MSPRHSSPLIARALLAACLCVVVLPACANPAGKAPEAGHAGHSAQVLAGESDSAVNTPYAGFARRRVEALGVELGGLVKQTIQHARQVRGDLEAELAAMEPPERLGSDDRTIRNWQVAEGKQHQQAVSELYEASIKILEDLETEALAQAVAMAEGLVGKRSPMDDGPTGDVTVDQTITSFEETLRAEVGLNELRARAQRDAISSIDLVQVFTTFAVADADELLGGRMVLFIGGEPGTESPHVKLVLKGQEAVPQNVRVLQAVRHRVFRGNTIAQDLGWQKMPRGPQISEHEMSLIVGNIEPRLDTTAEAFRSLYDMRVVSDLQTVIVQNQKVLGGVDWRIEFRVTTRGVVSWQVQGTPKFNAECVEARGAFGQL